MSFLLNSPSAPFLPEYVKSFWIKLKPWCSFTLRTLLGISLQNQSSVKSLNDFSSRWHLIAALKGPTGRLPNWVFFWLMTQSHKQNEVYVYFPSATKFCLFIMITLLTSVGSQKKQESSRKTSTSALLTTPNLWLCGSQQTVENSSRVGNTRPSYLPPGKSGCRSRSYS